MSELGVPLRFYRYTHHTLSSIHSKIIAEASVSLTVNGSTWLTFQCTPNQLEELAVGFLYNEGVIQTIDEIACVRLCESGDNVDIWLNHSVDRPSVWTRTAACAGGFTASSQSQPKNKDYQPVDPELLLTSMEELSKSQTLYREMGGVHCSALSDGVSVRISAEDIGRHNTLDKLAGLNLLSKSFFEPRVILTTGRISSDMLQKAHRIGAGVVVSRTSPTSESVLLAKDWGITLIGYARRENFLVFTYPERLACTDTWSGMVMECQDAELSAD